MFEIGEVVKWIDAKGKEREGTIVQSGKVLSRVWNGYRAVEIPTVQLSVVEDPYELDFDTE